MLQDFLPIAFIVIITTAIILFVNTLSRIMGPFRPTRRKSLPYESGMDPIGPARRRMPVKFYLVAVSFILFDIEIIFFLPWAVIMRDLGIYGLLAMGFFALVLVIGFAYEWTHGGLEWE